MVMSHTQMHIDQYEQNWGYKSNSVWLQLHFLLKCQSHEYHGKSLTNGAGKTGSPQLGVTEYLFNYARMCCICLSKEVPLFYFTFLRYLIDLIKIWMAKHEGGGIGVTSGRASK